ncbi:MAG TPA: hypothetical protein VE197_03455, partial [Mycobacterium sp.]|nr:hypothetical protein [Mycobacterium sp.]
FVYFPANSFRPFRIGTYLVRSPESGRHAEQGCGLPKLDGAMLEICGFAWEGAYLPKWSVKVPS